MRKRILYIVLTTLTALSLTSCSESKEELIAKIEDREIEADIQEPASLFDNTLPISVTYQDEAISLEEIYIYQDLSSDEESFNYYATISFDISDLSYDSFADLINDDTLEYCVSIRKVFSNNIDSSDFYFDNMGVTIDATDMTFYLSSVKDSIDLTPKCDIELSVNFPNSSYDFYSVSSIDILDARDIGKDVADRFNEYFENDPRYIWEQITTITPTPSATSEITPTNTPEPTPTIQAYGGGTLKVGTDIPAGEYIVFATDSDGGYFSVNSDANGDDIIFNENFGYNSIITVYDGEYLELSRSRAYPFNEWCAQNTIDITQEEATFKVGVNLPAGEYLLVATDEDGGYYCIYPDSRQQDIVANDNFEGQTYVNVSDGQYLTLSRCAISQ